ncbi:MAG: hypothetical protein IT451_03375 [Candidatus Brocadia sp.]|nr:hypothetical protein [Candidatus Brocadia sp.]
MEEKKYAQKQAVESLIRERSFCLTFRLLFGHNGAKISHQPLSLFLDVLLG